MTTIAIVGATGRMGKRLVALAQELKQLRLVAALEHAGHSQLGRDAGEVAGVGSADVKLSSELVDPPHVLIDFSAPEATRAWLAVARRRKFAMLIGTTGLTDADHRAIDAASADIPILQATNTSLGVAVLTKLVRDAAGMLADAEVDIEIVESHHRFKKDAPSGTASSLRDAIDDEAAREKVRMHSLRIGGEVGRHTVYFASLGERLELTHQATTRDTFAHGALRAAEWLAKQKPGRYRMSDVLQLGAI